MKRTFSPALTILLTLLVTLPAFAVGSVTKVATVNGLVCDFCAQAVSQAMKLQPGVEAVDINLSAKTVTVTMAANSPLTDDSRLGALLKEAGYDPVGVTTRR